ncbi:lipase 4 [Podospora fimiseda]|uniref:Carboxylic ester hydrolase n=1 Tax=Podospora fimiseda TaxID=252190 RepID=A0AAN7BI69_9PEZI|nr:lipase 4 [Podospora fimiseda]
MYPIITFFLLLTSVPFLYAANSTTANLGYASYTGIYNTSTQLTVWKGIRYAAPPIGKLRWQAPALPPPQTGGGAIIANKFGNACPQVLSNKPGNNYVFISGNEDCLFLNIWSPPTSGSKLFPVLVVIHGGGYGLGDGTVDMSGFIGGSGSGIVVVGVQYRLGAFGFLASPEVKSKGVLNAGLLDQRFALEWVQRHIEKFGGDRERVTLHGLSAGGGSLLLHAVWTGGKDGNKLFKNLITASPWIPTQPYYNDTVSVRDYTNFAAISGCSSGQEKVFDCLVGKDSLTLQYASHLVSTNSPTSHGNWAWKPVTDGVNITGPPSVMLESGKVNGERVLVGNNANEGPLIPPNNIATQDSLVAWLKDYFPTISQANITNILAAYPSSGGSVVKGYETSGYGPGTAVNISQVATGQQQRCYNIYAEAAVICPSYWLATAFSKQNKSAYHYQYSVPFAVHSADLSAYWGPATENQGPDLVNAFRSNQVLPCYIAINRELTNAEIYGNFIINDNPSISIQDANGLSSLTPGATNPATNWPAWTENNPALMNLNQTGGVPYTAVSLIGVPVTQFRSPGLRNNFTRANAYAWEGGRGARCELWRELGPYVRE